MTTLRCSGLCYMIGHNNNTTPNICCCSFFLSTCIQLFLHKNIIFTRLSVCFRHNNKYTTLSCIKWMDPPTVSRTDHSVVSGGSEYSVCNSSTALAMLHTGPHFLLFLDELDLATVKENPALSSLKLSCMMTHGYGYIIDKTFNPPCFF